jgi:hypothetical protein
MLSGRFWMSVPLLLVGMMSAASDEFTRRCSADAEPSSFDYLVLASIADAPRPLSMASYRPARRSDFNKP